MCPRGAWQGSGLLLLGPVARGPLSDGSGQIPWSLKLFGQEQGYKREQPASCPARAPTAARPGHLEPPLCHRLPRNTTFYSLQPTPVLGQGRKAEQPAELLNLLSYLTSTGFQAKHSTRSRFEGFSGSPRRRPAWTSSGSEEGLETDASATCFLG